MPTRFRRRSPATLAVLAALCLLGACTTPARLQNDYQGPLPAMLDRASERDGLLT